MLTRNTLFTTFVLMLLSQLTFEAINLGTFRPNSCDHLSLKLRCRFYLRGGCSEESIIKNSNSTEIQQLPEMETFCREEKLSGIDDLHSQERFRPHKETGIDWVGDGAVLKNIVRTGYGNVRPKDGDMVYIHYRAYVADGREFDDSRHRDTAESRLDLPYGFCLGKGEVCSKSSSSNFSKEYSLMFIFEICDAGDQGVGSCSKIDDARRGGRDLCQKRLVIRHRRHSAQGPTSIYGHQSRLVCARRSRIQQHLSTCHPKDSFTAHQYSVE